MKEHYTFSEVTLMSGLTPRTIRNHIRMGFLSGEKVDGIWRFTPEEIDCFLRNPSVLLGIQANRNAIVYDFMLERKKSSAQLCIIRDLPDENSAEVVNFFTQRSCRDDIGSGFRLSFESTYNNSRLILKGEAEDVLAKLNLFFHKVDAS